jgi:hypothetical protein
LIKAVGGLLDPRLPPAPQFAVYDAPLQVIPVTLEFVVGGGQEIIVLVVGERQCRVGPPHGVEVEQLLVLLSPAVIYGVDIGDFSHAIFRDKALEDKRVNVVLVYIRGIAATCARDTPWADLAAQAGDVSGNRGRPYGARA